MDNELKIQMEHLLDSKEDLSLQSKTISKILVYLLSMTLPDSSNNILLKRFLKRAFELLPSSSLPQQLATKLNIPIERTRNVFFSINNSCTPIYYPVFNFSIEGREQRKRELERENNSILGAVNLDPNRRFPPQQQITVGFKCCTRELSLTEGLMKNSFKPESSIGKVSKPKEILLPKINISEILLNPTLLRRFN